MEINTGPYDGPVSVQELEVSAKRAFKAVSSLAQDLKATIEAAKPDKATVEFSVELKKRMTISCLKLSMFPVKAASNLPWSGISIRRKKE